MAPQQATTAQAMGAEPPLGPSASPRVTIAAFQAFLNKQERTKRLPSRHNLVLDVATNCPEPTLDELLQLQPVFHKHLRIGSLLSHTTIVNLHLTQAFVAIDEPVSQDHFLASIVCNLVVMMEQGTVWLISNLNQITLNRAPCLIPLLTRLTRSKILRGVVNDGDVSHIGLPVLEAWHQQEPAPCLVVRCDFASSAAVVKAWCAATRHPHFRIALSNCSLATAQAIVNILGHNTAVHKIDLSLADTGMGALAGWTGPVDLGPIADRLNTLDTMAPIMLPRGHLQSLSLTPMAPYSRNASRRVWNQTTLGPDVRSQAIRASVKPRMVPHAEPYDNHVLEALEASAAAHFGIRFDQPPQVAVRALYLDHGLPALHDVGLVLLHVQAKFSNLSALLYASFPACQPATPCLPYYCCFAATHVAVVTRV